MLQGGSRFGAVHPIAGSLFHAVFQTPAGPAAEPLQATRRHLRPLGHGRRTQHTHFIPITRPAASSGDATSAIQRPQIRLWRGS